MHKRSAEKWRRLREETVGYGVAFAMAATGGADSEMEVGRSVTTSIPSGPVYGCDGIVNVSRDFANRPPRRVQ